MLARTFTAELLDEVIEAADVREIRYRRLPAWLMMVLTLACWLFTRSGYGLVCRSWPRRTRLRARAGQVGAALDRVDRQGLGAQQFRLLFARVAGPAGIGTPRGCSKGSPRNYSISFGCVVSSSGAAVTV